MLVFVLRHADKRPFPADDLSDAGHERAELLARMLARSGVRKAYHSGAVRARKTLDPLLHAVGPSLDVIELPDPPDLVRAIAALPETTVAVVVGHTNTVGPIIEALCGVAVPPIGDAAFDDLFMLTLNPAGRPNVTHLKYGAET